MENCGYTVVVVASGYASKRDCKRLSESVPIYKFRIENEANFLLKLGLKPLLRMRLFHKKC